MLEVNLQSVKMKMRILAMNQKEVKKERIGMNSNAKLYDVLIVLMCSVSLICISRSETPFL